MVEIGVCFLVGSGVALWVCLLGYVYDDMRMKRHGGQG